MVDLSNKKSCGSYGVSSSSTTTTSEIQEMIKRCADCGTSKTPLWRSGPAGPKTLCNACGIRSRKKRRVILGLKSEDNKKSLKKSNSYNNNNSTITSSTNSSTSSTSRLSGSPLHQRLLAIGREVMMRRSTVHNDRKKMFKLGEDEQAAVLLMALSYGSVSA